MIRGIDRGDRAAGGIQPAVVSPLYRGGVYPGLPVVPAGGENGEPFPAGPAVEVPRLLEKILRHFIYNRICCLAGRTGKKDCVSGPRPGDFFSWKIFHDGGKDCRWNDAPVFIAHRHGVNMPDVSVCGYREGSCRKRNHAKTYTSPLLGL